MHSVCKECGKITEVSRHIYIHNLKALDYFDKYYVGPEIKSAIALYEEGWSAQQICGYIREKTNGTLRPIKEVVLLHLKENGIKIRGTSEAIKEWNKKQGGPWNKGLTKNEHPSIKKYADSRLGKNNPYFKTAPEKRFDRFIQNNIGKQIRHYVSGPEKAISDTLANLGIKHLTQFVVMDGLVVDFFFPDQNTILEFNGDYWHCHPDKYSKDFFHKQKRKTAEQIWFKDQARNNTLNNRGYKVLTLWESTYAKFAQKELKEWLNAQFGKN
jgi:G:T-mismatch repair DNA endonuclease (very short patch repair protein)